MQFRHIYFELCYEHNFNVSNTQLYKTTKQNNTEFHARDT